MLSRLHPALDMAWKLISDKFPFIGYSAFMRPLNYECVEIVLAPWTTESQSPGDKELALVRHVAGLINGTIAYEKRGSDTCFKRRDFEFGRVRYELTLPPNLGLMIHVEILKLNAIGTKVIEHAKSLVK